MIEVIVLSDNHGLRQPIDFLRATYPSTDYFLHCGDSQMHPYELEGFCVVQGNTDHYQTYEREKIIQIGNHRIFITHGNHDLLWNDPTPIAHKAKLHDCDIALFGHTHVPFAKVIDDVFVLNPGSLSHNRDGSSPSYMVLQLDGDTVTYEKKVYDFPKKG